MLPIIAMHYFSCSYPESIPHLGCGQISPILSAPKKPIISRQSLRKWVSPTYTHTHPLPVTGSSCVRISRIPCLRSRKDRMPVALEATNGLQRQGEPEEFLEEEELHFVEGKLLSELSTWGIGGPAKYFVELHTEPQLLTALRTLQMFSNMWRSLWLMEDEGYFRELNSHSATANHPFRVCRTLQLL